MVDVNKIIKIAKEKDASDIHLVCGLKPMIRIKKSLVDIPKMDVLEEDDMYEIYDFFLRGNLEKDEVFKETKKLDLSLNFENYRLRVNISYAEEIPVFTIRLINNKLPKYEDLGIPEIVRKMAHEPQGLILVTGKINSGKTTTLNALIDDINENENKKILTLESPVEFKHECKKSMIIQKEVGKGRDCLNYSDGVKNSLREDCDIIVVGEIRDRETMDAAIEIAELGHLVIGTLHTKSCAETLDRVINFYDPKDQPQIKFIVSTLLRLVISQRLLKDTEGNLIMAPEVMVVDNVISGLIRKEKLNTSEIEDAIQNSQDKGSVSFIMTLAELFVDDKITLDQAKAQIDLNSNELLNRTIMQLKIKKGKNL